MNIYLKPEDDGLLMRKSGPWAVIKLDYLSRYINIFETSMRSKPWRKRHFIDLFSGPGKCFVPENKKIFLGSPLIALTTSHPFTDYFYVGDCNKNVLKTKLGLDSNFILSVGTTHHHKNFLRLLDAYALLKK